MTDLYDSLQYSQSFILLESPRNSIYTIFTKDDPFEHLFE